MRIAATAKMKAIDEMAIRELGIPSLELMERAASGVTEAVLEAMQDHPEGHVLVICGTGNNGGDGLACTRRLLSRGISASALVVGSLQKQTPDFKANAEALDRSGGQMALYAGQPLPECALIVDALFGFGLNRAVAGLYREVIERILASRVPVIACDIPSGLNGDSGEVMGLAVKAAVTVCFTCAKPGLLEAKAAQYVGQLRVVDIGIPQAALEHFGVKDINRTETIYLAGGCLWGVQHFVRSLPGVIHTEAGRANGTGDRLDGPYDGYAECVKTLFDPETVSARKLTEHLFEIIDPYSVNKQGIDVGPKYRTGVYSTEPSHLEEARAYLASRPDRDRIAVEVLPLTNYVRSAQEHQDRLERFPNDYCHIPLAVMNKYR